MPGAARSAAEVATEPSSAAAANEAVAATDAPLLAVVFDATLRDGAIEAAAGALLDEPSGEAVLLLGGDDGVDEEAAATVVDYGRLARADLDVRGIVVRRAAWERCGGFDETLPDAALDAWALALAVAADGGGLRQVQAAVAGARAPHSDSWATARRTAAARHGELLARDLLPASDALAAEVLERGDEVGAFASRLAEASTRRDEIARERDQLARELGETSAKRDEVSDRWAEACRQRDEVAERLAEAAVERDRLRAELEAERASTPPLRDVASALARRARRQP